jgi:hypothetical protein
MRARLARPAGTGSFACTPVPPYSMNHDLESGVTPPIPTMAMEIRRDRPT